MIINQISVFLENDAGKLLEITDTLAGEGIDLRAIHIAETASYGVLRLIASDAEKASSVLSAHGFVVSMTPVVPIAVPDEVGTLSKVLHIIADANINIEYMYSIFGGHDNRAFLVFRVTQPENLLRVLQEYRIETASAEELGIC